MIFSHLIRLLVAVVLCLLVAGIGGKEARGQTGSVPMFDINNRTFLEHNTDGIVDRVLVVGVHQHHHNDPILLPPKTPGDGAAILMVTPDLPEGISIRTGYAGFDRIQGLPTTPQPRTTYTLILHDGDSDASAEDGDTFIFHLRVILPGAITTFDASPYIDEILLADSYTTIQLPEAMSSDGGDLTYSVTNLPDGLTFTPSTRQITGTPTATQEKKQYTLTARDVDGFTALFIFYITIEENIPPVFASPPVDRTLVVGVDMLMRLPKADGGNLPLTYEISPSLPMGLDFDPETHLVIGTPVAVQMATTYTLTARDRDGETDTTTFTLTIREDNGTDSEPDFGSPSQIIWTFTPDNIGAGLDLPTIETGGDGVLAYEITPSLSSGSGLIFDAGRHTIIHAPSFVGFPLMQEDTTYTLTATDEDGDADTFTFTIAVSNVEPIFDQQVEIDKTFFLGGSDSIILPTAKGGNGPLTFTVNPPLPPGLILRTIPPADIVDAITGTPTAVQEKTEYTLTATDRDGQTASFTFDLTVSGDSPPRETVSPTPQDRGPAAEANRETLPRVSVAIAYEMTGAIRDRVREAFSDAGRSGVYVKGGDWRQFFAAEASRANERGEIPDINLSDLAFSLAASEWGGSGYDFGGRSIGFRAWGRGYYRDIDFSDDINLEGAITGGIVGVDTIPVSNVLTGVSANLFNADVDFSKGSNEPLSHKTTAWSVHPYLGWQPVARTVLWATGGYGMGEVEVATTDGGCPSGGCLMRDVSLITLGGGGSVHMGNIRAGSGRVNIDMIGDVSVVRVSEDLTGGLESDAGVARFGLEFGYGRPLGLDNNFGSDIGFSYRTDFGDVKSGSGFEAEGDINFSSPRAGLRFEAKGRALISGIDKVEEWGVSGDLLWSYSSGGTGPYVKFSPEWGATNDRREDLWERGVSELGVSGDNDGRRYVMEAGYGVSVLGEIMTFFVRNEIEDGEMALQSGGVDIETTGGLRAGYETVSRTGRQPEHRGYLRYAGKF